MVHDPQFLYHGWKEHELETIPYHPKPYKVKQSQNCDFVRLQKNLLTFLTIFRLSGAISRLYLLDFLPNFNIL